MMMRKGDKMEVKISASIKYGNYKQYLKGAQMQVDLYKKVLPLAKKIMKLPKSVSLEVRPIKGRTQGLYFNARQGMEVDTRTKTLGDFLVTVMHELVHAEQYHTGRLKGGYEYGKGYVNYWNGEANTGRGSKGKTYSAYRKLPWEEEAWGRQEKLAQDVTKMLFDKGIDVNELEKKYAECRKK